jgi:hypothetical protein
LIELATAAGLLALIGVGCKYPVVGRPLICDNDKKFPLAFERVLAGEGVRV